MAAVLYLSNPPATERCRPEVRSTYPLIYRAALQTHLAQTVMDEEVSIQMQVNTTGSRKALEVP